MAKSSFLRGFKAFAMRGNVIAMAVGVILGTAFRQIASSVVPDTITPLFGVILGGIDFKGLSVTVGDSVITYGNFIQATFDFVIIAFSIFLFIRLISNLHSQKEAEKPAEPAAPSKEEQLLTEIRDLLKEKK